MDLEKKYPCADCGKLAVARSMFICAEDDKLRCSPCILRRLDLRQTEGKVSVPSLCDIKKFF